MERLPEFDLTMNEGWEAFNGLTEHQAMDSPDKTTVATVTTDDAGLAVVNDLPLGVYLVTENTYLPGAVPATPRLITVPTLDPEDRSTWMYNVHVYLQNGSSVPEQVVNDVATVAIGDTMELTTRGDIPSVEVITSFRIVHPLDARLSYDHEGSPARLGLVNAGGFALVGGDYTVVSAAVDGRVTVTAEFTAAGLAKLVQAKKAFPAAQVELVVPTTVNAIGDGNIESHGEVQVDHPGMTPPADPPSDPVTTPEDVQSDGIVTPPVSTKWGKISILKVDGEERPLAGLIFRSSCRRRMRSRW